MSSATNRPRAVPAEAAIHPDTSLGAVQLTVADLDRGQAFYEHAIGLVTLDRSGEVTRLGTRPGGTLVELVGRPDAPPRPRRSTGLFHLALLVSSRAELACAVRRVTQAGWSFTGASDHLVSEAVYLHDPEGNGIEIYRDRPRDEWRRVDGQLQMATLPLDLDSVMGELPVNTPDEGMAAGTSIGHVHLNVADLASAEAFYHGVLGFDVTVRGYPGALFLSAGGYHHHLGLNTWAGENAPTPARGSRGLRSFAIALPGAGELARISQRLAAAGLDPQPQDGALLVADPSGDRVLLNVAAP